MTTPRLLFVLVFFSYCANFASSEQTDTELNSAFVVQLIVNTIIREPLKMTPDKIAALVGDPEIAAAFNDAVDEQLVILDKDLDQYATILKSSSVVLHRSIKHSNELLTSAEAKVKENEETAKLTRKRLNVLEVSTNTLMNLTDYLHDGEDDNESGRTLSMKSLTEDMKDRMTLIQHLKASNERTQRRNHKLQEILTKYKPAILRCEQLVIKFDGIVKLIQDHLESSKEAKTVEEKANKLRHTVLLSRQLTEQIEQMTTEAKEVFRDVNELREILNDVEKEEAPSDKQTERKRPRDEL